MQARTLKVSGMTCSGCEQRVSAVLGRLDGVGRVTADHSTGVVTVDHDPDLVEQRTIDDRLAEAGYEVVEDGRR